MHLNFTLYIYFERAPAWDKTKSILSNWPNQLFFRIQDVQQLVSIYLLGSSEEYNLQIIQGYVINASQWDGNINDRIFIRVREKKKSMRRPTTRKAQFSATNFLLLSEMVLKGRNHCPKQSRLISASPMARFIFSPSISCTQRG